MDCSYKRKSKSNKKTKVVRFRCSNEDYRFLVSRSEFFHDGNMSKLIRDAVKEYRIKNGSKKN